MAGTDDDSGLLNGVRMYLSGPMYFGGSQHSGTDEGWRHRVTEVLQDHGATVFNPWRKPTVRGLGNYGREGEQNQPYRERFGYDDTEEGAAGRAHCAHQARPMLHVDLRMIDASDLMIAFCPTSVYSVGTVHEIARAREQRKPVLLVTPPTVFPAFDELRTHLATDTEAQALLDQLAEQASLRPNPGAIPSSWYMALVDSESFFDGFGFDDVRDEHPAWADGELDALERRFPPKRPLFRFLESIASGRIPDRRDHHGRTEPNDDWLLFDLALLARRERR
jgi:hypothetical protein